MAIVRYSSKATAVRGVTRMGIADKAQAASLVEYDGDANQYTVDADAVNEAIAASKRGDAVVEGADKGDVADAAIRVTASAAEQMTQDEIDADLAATCGYSECPSCGIHLSNGLMDYDSLVDAKGSAKEAYALQKHEWSCMGCNAEWGKEIPAPSGSKPKGEPTRHYVNKSTVDGAVAMSHEIYNANPDARRKDAIQLAVDAGIAFYTARTQYQKWFKAQKSNKAK